MLLPMVAFLAAISLAKAQLGVKSCIDQLQAGNANLTKVLECLASSDNRTAFMEETFWKIDLLDRRLDKMAATQPAEKHVASSPYVHIDDVLHIQGSVAGYSCQAKQQVVQAIRRKLYHIQLRSGKKSTLFEWPFSEQKPNGKNAGSTDLINFMPKTFANLPPKELFQISCVLRLALDSNSSATTKKIT